MRETPRFAIGQRVFVADASPYASTKVPCPVCFGDLSVKVILGNGEVQPIECTACGLGFDGPQGFINATAPVSSVTEGEVDGIEADHSHGDRWRYSVGGRRADHVFATREEAETKRAELFEEAKAAAERMNDSFAAEKKKGLAWQIRYHRDQIKAAERTIEWNRKKLSECESRKAKRGGAA